MHDTLGDEELLRLMQSGDERAFVTLYHRRQGGIYRFALRMSGSEAVAEDVTQDVFVSLIGKNGHYDFTRGTLQSYLYGIARNQVLRRIVKDRANVPIEDENCDQERAIVGSTDPLVDLTRRETIESLRQAILSLPPHYREVIALCDLQEMSYTETAEILECAVGTVRSRLHRARAMLVEKLGAQNKAEKDSARIVKYELQGF